MNKFYDIIIIGAGPVGSALAIELGLQGINTLIIEKKSVSKKRNRMVSLSIRSAELCTRWKVLDKLYSTDSVKNSLPVRCVSSSTLNGKLYSNTEYEKISGTLHNPIRISIDDLETSFRQHMTSFDNIYYIKESEVQDIEIIDDNVLVKVLDKKENKVIQYNSYFVACADGTNGISKKIFNNNLQALSKPTKMLSVYFISDNIFINDNIPHVMMYVIINEKVLTAFLSVVNIKENKFIVQFVVDHENSINDISEKAITSMINDIAGHDCKKQILEYQEWTMLPQIASECIHEGKVIWLGDAVHSFAPTGGMGLNTGLGDVYNLGWKLCCAVKNKKTRKYIIDSYKQERYPVWQNNLIFSRENAVRVKKIYLENPPNNCFNNFVSKNIKLGDKLMSSSHLNSGYNYKNIQKIKYEDDLQYIPKLELGCFLPELNIDNHISIYKILCPKRWNLIINNLKENQNSTIEKLKEKLHIIYIKSQFKYRYIYLRPDWHIEIITNKIEDIIKRYEIQLV